VQFFKGRTCAQSLGLCANFRLVCFLRRSLFYVIPCCKILFAQASKFRMTDPNFPAELLNWLDGWGGRLKDLVTDGCKQAWATCTATVHSPQSALPPMLRVGTDCSGIEAPVHALLGLGLPHQHMWSSEAAEAPRKVSLANTRPEKMFTDVVSSSQGEAPAFVELYVSGFSCKPFSTLHHQSKLLQEDEAEVFLLLSIAYTR
jgi:hypothetical protein